MTTNKLMRVRDLLAKAKEDGLLIDGLDEIITSQTDGSRLIDDRLTEIVSGVLQEGISQRLQKFTIAAIVIGILK